jgi:pimeloyl-ACP methyl ester carboxylesterase
MSPSVDQRQPKHAAAPRPKAWAAWLLVSLLVTSSIARPSWADTRSSRSAHRGDEGCFAAVSDNPGDHLQQSHEPDVWVVSSRCLGATCSIPREAPFVVERLGPTTRGLRFWQPANLEGLLSEPERPLAIFIHGNRYAEADAKRQGLTLARRLSTFCPTAADTRTVIFSWPSEKQGLLLADGRAKYERSHSDARYVASLLQRVDPRQPLAIVGYSFGGLIALEALEDSCGSCSGAPSGVTALQERSAPTNVVLVAPAVRSDALAPGGPYRTALSCIDRMQVIINSQDDALRFFPLLDKRVDLPALGFVGMPWRWIPPDVAFSIINAASIVGKQHSLELYLQSAKLSRQIAEGALLGF